MPGHGKEARAIREILASQPADRRLFRINAGVGWIGRIVHRKSDSLLLANPRALHAAPRGWPDLCGWETIEITPDMVGERLAVFLAVEVKATGKLSRDQEKFRDVLTRMGGRFEVAGSPSKNTAGK